jgi:hypothetical protein
MAVADVPELNDAVPAAGVDVERIKWKIPGCEDRVLMALIVFARPALFELPSTFVPNLNLRHFSSNYDLTAISCAIYGLV